ncbi:MAG: ABC transporter ATP-binding protein [Proteobacteria bacterium]|nr:ABC transporter ATP-binding protein [Pseudomonadota bacterium]
MITASPTLSVRDLSVSFGATGARLQALDRVSFDVARGEILALVGESGCGKSVTMMAILGLLPERVARIEAQRIQLGELDLRKATPKALRTVRGRRIGMIFQDPMTSLTPVHTVGFQIAEVMRAHQGLSRRAAQARALELLDLVRIPDPRRRLDAYPHELSGGMRQRVMIAIALACAPELLIADEPTTALDVTVQAQIMELIADLRREMGMSVVLITHDLGVVATTADRVAVMYAGRIVEEAPVADLFRNPSHGYTAGLIRSLPGGETERQTRLAEIPGNVPRFAAPPNACAFTERCAFALPGCATTRPPDEQISQAHRCACFNREAVAAALRDTPFVRAWV